MAAGRDDALDAKSALLGYSPRSVLLIVSISATIMVLWPLGGLQALEELTLGARRPNIALVKSDSPLERHKPSVQAHDAARIAQEEARLAADATLQARQQLRRAHAEVKELREELALLKVGDATQRPTVAAERSTGSPDWEPLGVPRPGAALRTRPVWGPPHAAGHWPPLAAGQTLADRAATSPRVGGSIAVHPPKFAFVGRFLEQWYVCEPARRAMHMYIVFWGDKDAALFKKGMAKNHPQVPESAWTAVVCEVPGFASVPGGISSQIIAAWKKWYGITYMMDLEKPPMYGLMLDSELLLYNTSDCGPNSEWYRMFDRLQSLEASKTWKAARVDDRASYDFGAFKQSGKDYDRLILEDNARFIGALPVNQAGPDPKCEGVDKHGEVKLGTVAGCREVKRILDLVLFSW